MKPIISVAAVVAAVLTVLSTRFVVPALILIFRSIERSSTPSSDAAGSTPVLEAVPDAPAKPRATRKRSSAKPKATTEVVKAEKVAAPKRTTRKPRASASLKVVEGFS